ncbi:MAG TPA: BrnT family toxin [Acidobacteriota bacterium]
MSEARFDWDPDKDRETQSKHGVAFATAQFAFADPRRVIAEDLSHSSGEERYYCFGEVGGGILTVRFTYREAVIRIFGAGYWRRGKRIYDRENQIHR